MPTPNVYFKIALAFLVLLLASFCGWYPEHLAFVAYKEKVFADGKIQEQKNKDLIIQQQLITKQVQNDYQNKLDRIKSYYSGLHYSSGGKLSNPGNPPLSTLGITKDPVSVAQDCAIETEKLLSLQEWVKSQIKVNDE